MSKLFGWLFSPLYLLLSMLTLLVWHPLIMVTRYIHPKLHQRIIEFGNLLLLIDLFAVGSRVKFKVEGELPESGPIIVVSNHQSVLDIPMLIWAFRKYYAKFIAKQELAYGVPSASYVLRTGGSALINRKNPIQAIPEIKRFAQFVKEGGYAACIFPEGTRARDGKLKAFKPHGLRLLLEELPNAPIVLAVIERAWELMRYRFAPVPFGIQVKCTILGVMARADNDEETISKIHSIMAARLN